MQQRQRQAFWKSYTADKVRSALACISSAVLQCSVYIHIHGISCSFDMLPYYLSPSPVLSSLSFPFLFFPSLTSSPSLCPLGAPSNRYGPSSRGEYLTVMWGVSADGPWTSCLCGFRIRLSNISLLRPQKPIRRLCITYLFFSFLDYFSFKWL